MSRTAFGDIAFGKFETHGQAMETLFNPAPTVVTLNGQVKVPLVALRQSHCHDSRDTLLQALLI